MYAVCKRIKTKEKKTTSPEPSLETSSEPCWAWPPEPSSEPCWTWRGFAPKPPRPSPEPSPELSPERGWTWPGSAPKPPSGTSGTRLNLTWLCTKASLRNLLRNLLRNPVEPDPALHQSLPDLLRNLLRNLVEPDLALHQSLPEPSPVPSPEPCWTWPGLLRNPLQNPLNLTSPSTKAPEPSPGPCRTSPGSAPKPPRPSPGTFSGTLLNLTWFCTKASWNLTWLCAKASQTFSGTFGWTWPSACTTAHRNYSGLKTPLAYAVGGKERRLWGLLRRSNLANARKQVRHL